MMRRIVREGARISRALAALGACVVLGRFAVDAWAWAGERDETTPEVARRRPLSAAEAEPREPEPEESSAARDEAKIRRAAGRTASDVSSKPPPPKRRTLFVDLGPPRSEVYVNGVAVGRTPYAGTWGCHDGDEVRIVVIWPGSSPPIEAVARCGPAIVADKAGQSHKLDAKAVEELMNDQGLAPALKEALKRRAAR